ncbi:hypothetical protein BH11CYA1_BH11CYA1_09020 [soil metagenome]
MTTVVIWAACGPAFKYSETWQIVINTATTIITFLMVFLIQRTQNKDVTALHAKLNELIASQAGASNRLVNVEDLNEEQLEEIRKDYHQLSDETDSGQQKKSIEDVLSKPNTVRGA